MMLHGKGELKLQMELRLQISCRDGEIILNHTHGPNVITRVLKMKDGRTVRVREGGVTNEAGLECCNCLSFKMKGSHEPRNVGSSPKLEKARKHILEPSEGTQPAMP